MMSINEVFQDEITKITALCVPEHLQPVKTSSELRSIRTTVWEAIDRLGRHSASSQGLSKVITTYNKLESSNCIVYIVKDGSAKNGAGEAIGLLKVGRKNLFLNRKNNSLLEVSPWCILDFFVEPSYQRHGLGAKLIDYMLRDLDLSLNAMAVDGPSQSMNAFLEKKYGIVLEKQSNNFALPPKFFDYVDHIRAASGDSTPVSGGAGRFTAIQPRSDIGKIIHGDSPLSSTQRCTSGSERELSTPASEVARQVEEEVPRAEASPAPEEPPSVEPLTLEEIRSDEECVRAAERPNSLPVAAASEAGDSAAPSPAGSVLSRRDSQLTEKGYFDVKFYHNKLW